MTIGAEEKLLQLVGTHSTSSSALLCGSSVRDELRLHIPWSSESVAMCSVQTLGCNQSVTRPPPLRAARAVCIKLAH